MSDYTRSRWYPMAVRLYTEMMEHHQVGAYRHMVAMAEEVERELSDGDELHRYDCVCERCTERKASSMMVIESEGK